MQNSSNLGLSHSTRVDVIDAQAGRILLVADIRGNLSQLNDLADQHNAKAIIHTGDFGFYELASVPRITDRTLKHLVQYSNAITPIFRNALLQPGVQPNQLRQMLANPPPAFLPNHQSNGQVNGRPEQNFFALSEFPKLLTGELRLKVPVYTVWGACEDVGVLERLRVAPPAPIFTNSQPSGDVSQQANWCIPNLTVLSEACTRTLVIGGVRLRLFGLGGAHVPHKMFDNGDGQGTVAGGGGTMWTTMLQIGELVDTAARVFDPSETRVLVTHASPGREGLIAQLALALKADMTVSASLHFRYGVSYNEFSVQHDVENYRNKFVVAKGAFAEVWDSVKQQVEAVIEDNQRKYLNNALAVTNRVPNEPMQTGSVEEPAWKNTWHWNLPDAAFGNLVLDFKEGRVNSEMRSQGFNFSYRAGANRAPPSGPAANFNAPTGPSGSRPFQKGQQNYQGPRQQQQQQQQPTFQQPQQSEQPSQPKTTDQPPHSVAPQKQPYQQGPKHHKKDFVRPAPEANAGSNEPKPVDTQNGDNAAPSASIERPASSASSRRASHHGKRGGSHPSGPSSRDESAGQDSPNEAGQGPPFEGRGRGRGRGMRGAGRGSFDRGRGGKKFGQPRAEGDNGPSPSTTPAPAATPTLASASASAPAAPKASE